jgi:hypothetical protein
MSGESNGGRRASLSVKSALVRVSRDAQIPRRDLRGWDWAPLELA